MKPLRPGGPVARVGAQARFEMGLLLRNGEQLLLTLVLPALLLVVVSRTDVVTLPGDSRIDVVAPGVLALAVMSTGFTSQAITTAFDRRHGVLRLLATTPLGRTGLLAGKVGAVAGVLVGQVLVLGAVALALGWRPQFAGLLPALLVLATGAAAFTALGLLLGGVLRAEAVLALANLLWVLLVVGGGVLVPTSTMPAPWSTLARWLPSGALGDGLRAALTDGTVTLFPLLVLAGWALAAAAAVRAWFRWS